MQVYIVLGTWLDEIHGQRTEIMPRRAYVSYDEAQKAIELAESAVTAITGKPVEFHIETLQAY